MKKLLALLTVLLAVSTVQAADFTSFQIASTTLTNGFILQTNGKNNKWVATSSLGFTASSFSTTSILGLATTSFSFITGISGTDFNIATTTTAVIFNIPDASVSARGLLTSANFTIFNNKLSQNFNVASGTGLTIGNFFATNTASITGGLTFVNATGTTLFVTNASTTNLNFTNASSTGGITTGSLFATNGRFTTSSSTNSTTTNFNLSGWFRDSLNATGTVGQYLLSTGTSTKWTTISAGVGCTSAGSAGTIQYASSTGGACDGTSTFAYVNSRLGIGTSTPLAIVHILSSLTNLTTLATQATTSQTAPVLDVWNSVGSSLLNVQPTGLVGIGTSTPLDKLSIVGSEYLSGAFKDSTSATGTLNQVLLTTGTSTLWVSTSSIFGAGTVPGGLNTQVQYNNAGVFGGISGATTNGTILSLTNALLGGATLTTSSVNGVTLTTGGSATTFLNGAGSYTAPVGTIYTGTYPIIVTGTVISTGFGTGTPNNFTAQNNFQTASSSGFTVGNLFATSSILFTGGFTFGNATGTNLFVTNASTTNATSSNLFSVNSNILNGTSSNWFSTNASTTNATATLFFAVNSILNNASTTNIFSTNASSTNATSSNFFAVNANILNGTTTNWFSTVGSSSLFRITNASTTNLSLIGKLIDSTNASGTLGLVLQSTGTSTLWVSTSSLNITASLSGGINGRNAFWTGVSTMSASNDFFDNSTVSGVNATSSTINFNVQGTGTNSSFNVASSSGESRFRVLSNGRIGISSTTPVASFTIQGTSTDPIVQISSVSGIFSYFSIGNTGLITQSSTTMQSLTMQGPIIGRTVGYASAASTTINVDTTDTATTTITATTTFVNFSGTPFDMQMVEISAVATTTYGLFWGTIFASSTQNPSPTTIASGTTQFIFQYDRWRNKWMFNGYAPAMN